MCLDSGWRSIRVLAVMAIGTVIPVACGTARGMWWPAARARLRAGL
jgi:hypothetical protein